VVALALVHCYLHWLCALALLFYTGCVPWHCYFTLAVCPGIAIYTGCVPWHCYATLSASQPHEARAQDADEPWHSMWLSHVVVTWHCVMCYLQAHAAVQCTLVITFEDSQLSRDRVECCVTSTGRPGRHYSITQDVPPLSDSTGGRDGPLQEGGGGGGDWGSRADSC